MTEILEVTPESTLNAVRRQLMRLRRQRVALLLPDDWQELQNPAQVRLLQRQAQRQRCELGFITRNEQLHQLAHSVGVPTFVKPAEAMNGSWHMSPLVPLLNPRRLAAGLPDEPRWKRRKIIDLETTPTYFCLLYTSPSPRD